MAITVQINKKSPRGVIEIIGSQRTVLKSHGISVVMQAKTVVPGDSEQVITADPGFFLREVIVSPVPNTQYARLRYNGSTLTVY